MTEKENNKIIDVSEPTANAFFIAMSSMIYIKRKGLMEEFKKFLKFKEDILTIDVILIAYKEMKEEINKGLNLD